MDNKELERIYNDTYRSVYWTAMSLLKNETDAKGQKIPFLVIKLSVLSDVLYDRGPLSETGDALIPSFAY